MNRHEARLRVLAEVAAERERQDETWGEQNHPDGTGYAYLRDQAEKAKRECDAAHRTGQESWRLILREEYREAMAERDPFRLRAELIQVAAVAIAWAEAIDRRKKSAMTVDVCLPRGFRSASDPAVDHIEGRGGR